MKNFILAPFKWYTESGKGIQRIIVACLVVIYIPFATLPAMIVGANASGEDAPAAVIGTILLTAILPFLLICFAIWIYEGFKQDKSN